MKRILVVNGEKELRHRLVEKLEKAGFFVEHTGRLNELDKFDLTKFDILIINRTIQDRNILGWLLGLEFVPRLILTSGYFYQSSLSEQENAALEKLQGIFYPIHRGFEGIVELIVWGKI